ncbi:hypothetical protein KI387_044061 [Taxus chinensis]|uniref:Uncharacterized protein n=1 Tax=Taxus chinensis TaxID=29808 RepID=A0AA38FZ25_TAXCH|nr:hypothetical protein KI387_044061 [Taxus chinensis]
MGPLRAIQVTLEEGESSGIKEAVMLLLFLGEWADRLIITLKPWRLFGVLDLPEIVTFQIS